MPESERLVMGEKLKKSLACIRADRHWLEVGYITDGWSCCFNQILRGFIVLGNKVGQNRGRIMLLSVFSLSLIAAVLAAPSTVAPPQNEAVDSQAYPVPQIDWGKCPQLKPTEADKEQKRLVIQKCLDQNPPPSLETVTDPKQIDDHRELVTTCALKTEGWFNVDGSYKFERAKTEIESKKLDSTVEKNISKRHQECQEEAVKRFPGGHIEQVQLYQACMDYHIAEICEIELIPPPGGFPIEEFGDYDLPPEQPNKPLEESAQPQPARAN